MRIRASLPVLLLALLLRLPFLNQAIQGDDVYYLYAAQHAQIDPAHPHHARYVFQGRMVDMRGHPHPPLNAWCLAGLLALAGDVREVPFHAAYIVFSLIAAAGMWSLARRFSPHPLMATLLFLATPAFVINGNSLESDIPFLAFWMASMALWIRAVDSGSGRWLGAAAAAMAIGAMAAFQSIVIVPIAALYLWTHRRAWRVAWLALLATPLALAAYQAIERVSSGALPAAVLAGYFDTYGLQSLKNKLYNAGALTTHLGWILFPPLALAAFRKGLIWALLPAAAGAALLDPNPLFWIPFATGITTLAWCIRRWHEFLAAWVLVFFAAAIVLFFAGSARYLLPVAAPVALLASRELAPRWLAAGAAAQLALSLALSVVNYQHWDGYRTFVTAHSKEWESKRVWINGEWGLRFYAESVGGLALERGQAVRPGEYVLSSKLALPIYFATGGGTPAPVAAAEIRSPIPLRLVGLTAKSAYSASEGWRAFDISTGAIDRVQVEAILERKPTLSFVSMKDPEADRHIVSGIDHDRWMGARAAITLKPPPTPTPVTVELYLSEQAPARHVTLTLDGVRIAEATLPGPGMHTVRSPAVTASSDPSTLVIELDKTFSVPNDQRELGAVVAGAGFR